MKESTAVTEEPIPGRRFLLIFTDILLVDQEETALRRKLYHVYPHFGATGQKKDNKEIGPKMKVNRGYSVFMGRFHEKIIQNIREIMMKSSHDPISCW